MKSLESIFIKSIEGEPQDRWQKGTRGCYGEKSSLKPHRTLGERLSRGVMNYEKLSTTPTNEMATVLQQISSEKYTLKPHGEVESRLCDDMASSQPTQQSGDKSFRRHRAAVSPPNPEQTHQGYVPQPDTRQVLVRSTSAMCSFETLSCISNPCSEPAPSVSLVH